jgi:hypothetical protein
VGQSTPERRIDPDLLSQIDAAEAGGGRDPAPVQAVVYLKPPDPAQHTVPPDELPGVVAELLSRVERKVGRSAGRHNTFRNLGSFAVEAPPEFIRELIHQPEVASAVANRRG